MGKQAGHEFTAGIELPVLSVHGATPAAPPPAAPAVSVVRHAKEPSGPSPANVSPNVPPRLRRRQPSRRGIVLAALAVLAIAGSDYLAVPAIIHSLNTVSTDDAFVNGHVTFVAAPVPGQVVKVLVDDNYRVQKGDILVQLDRQPYQVIVDAKRAAQTSLRQTSLSPMTRSAQWWDKCGPIATSCSTPSRT